MRHRGPDLRLDVDYVDTGCNLHSRCLSCPFAICKYDAPRGADTRRILQALLSEGVSDVNELARLSGVSRHTVYRQLKAL